MAVTLKEARNQANLTQEQAAHEAGLAVATYRRVEDGRVADPAYSTVLAICDAVGRKPEEICEFSHPALRSGQRERGAQT